MKKKISMTQSAHGCEDGYTSRHYKQGEVYDLEDHLADNFISAGFAVIHKDDEKSKQEHADKSLSEKNYSNKSLSKKGENQ